MDTENKVYHELRKFLDTMPGGFSATKSGSNRYLLVYHMLSFCQVCKKYIYASLDTLAIIINR